MKPKRYEGLKGLGILAICAYLVLAGVTMPVPASAAEPAADKPKEAAAQPEQTPEEAAGGMRNLIRLRRACETDTKRFCADVKPGGGRLLKCLHEHEKELAPACREALGPGSSKP